MNEEPFGPVAVMLRFKDTDDVLAARQQAALRARQPTPSPRTPRRRPRWPTRSRSGMVDHQPLRHRAARDAVRRRQGLRASATKAASKACRSTCRPSSSAIWAADTRRTRARRQLTEAAAFALAAGRFGALEICSSRRLHGFMLQHRRIGGEASSPNPSIDGARTELIIASARILAR